LNGTPTEFVVEPDVPTTASWKLPPLLKLFPLMMRVTVAGNVLTDVGLMLQLLTPKVFPQLKVTVPAKPSWDEIVIGPLVPVLPSFTFGKVLGSLNMKSGFVVTASVNEEVKGEGAPGVVACSVTV
jgi:hypothetical protein